MPFNPEDCIIPQFWCGNGNVPPQARGKRYLRAGTRYECMKKGFGAGMAVEKKKFIPPNSLQQIRYVGDKTEANFRLVGIATIDHLIVHTRTLSEVQKQNFIRSVVGVRGTKAYNSILLFLHERGLNNLPRCVRL